MELGVGRGDAPSGLFVVRIEVAFFENFQRDGERRIVLDDSDLRPRFGPVRFAPHELERVRPDRGEDTLDRVEESWLVRDEPRNVIVVDHHLLFPSLQEVQIEPPWLVRTGRELLGTLTQLPSFLLREEGLRIYRVV